MSEIDNRSNRTSLEKFTLEPMTTPLTPAREQQIREIMEMCSKVEGWWWSEVDVSDALHDLLAEIDTLRQQLADSRTNHLDANSRNIQANERADAAEASLRAVTQERDELKKVRTETGTGVVADALVRLKARADSAEASQQALLQQIEALPRFAHDVETREQFVGDGFRLVETMTERPHAYGPYVKFADLESLLRPVPKEPHV